jgi:hypothetical protein
LSALLDPEDIFLYEASEQLDPSDSWVQHAQAAVLLNGYKYPQKKKPADFLPYPQPIRRTSAAHNKAVMENFIRKLKGKNRG